jgi:F-box interacting protein
MSSTMNHNLIQQLGNSPSDFSLYPLRPIFTSSTTTNTTEIMFPLHNGNYFDDSIRIVASCDGILCSTVLLYNGSITVVLWNPSIRKYNILPPLGKKLGTRYNYFQMEYGFGYDNITDNYKVVAVSMYKCYSSGILKTQSQVNVLTFGTTSWRLIDEFPFGSFGEFSDAEGKFVSGTINWLVFKRDSTLQHIISLDLGTESYQEILQPEYGEQGVKMVRISTLGVLRDCLCILRGRDIWLMKEYGNRDSWTKFATVPHLGWYNYYLEDVLCISEDDHVLLKFKAMYELKLAVYDSVNRTLKSLDIKTKGLMRPKIYIESLISPCS